MDIQEDRRGNVVVLAPSGDMDTSTLPAFESRFSALLDDGVRGVLWDLSAVGILPSAGVGFFLQSGRRLRAVKGAMALARAGKLATSTLRTLGVLEVFQLYDDVESGVAALKSRLD